MTRRMITLETRRGTVSIESSLSLEEAAQVLREAQKAGLLDDFEENLLRTYRSPRVRMSPKQADWLVYKAQVRLNPAPTPQPMGVTLRPILDLLAKLAEHVKRPALKLKTSDDRPVVLRLAGAHSRLPGSINVTDGKSFGENKWYGRIHQDGTTNIEDAGVLELFARLAQDPAGVAAEIGHATGNCVVCGQALTNTAQGSARTGYGEICAGHLGWPWAPNGKDWTERQGAAVHLAAE